MIWKTVFRIFMILVIAGGIGFSVKLIWDWFKNRGEKGREIWRSK